MGEAPDNWWDQNHHNESTQYILKHFTDKELQAELNSRQYERRKMEILKIVGLREAISYFTLSLTDDKKNAEWELHIVFTDGTKHSFVFSSKVGQDEITMDNFRMLYFPNLIRTDYVEYQRFAKSKQNQPKKKKKLCHGR